MERKQKRSSISALREELMRSLSPARLRSFSPAYSGALSRFLYKTNSMPAQLSSMVRSGSLRSAGAKLEPLREGPDSDGGETEDRPKRSVSGLGSWMKVQFSKAPSFGQGCDVRLLIGVMGAPLAPVHVGLEESFVHFSIKDASIENSSAQYIIQQYIAASGGQKHLNLVGNAYAMGKVKMLASTFETATGVKKNRNVSQDLQSGGFVLWQMCPGKWYVELAVGDSKVHAGCDGKLVWRHTPWLGAHPAKGPVRPLRRALQGLDPRTTASIFNDSRCVGEKRINGEDCFILKLCADAETLKARSEGPAEIIRHAMLGYFSQRTGLLIHLEDSHLTRIQTIGGDAVYWETTINSFINDYRPVEGIMIAHSGTSSVTLLKFGELALSHSKIIMEEAWTIEEVTYNVPGLSEDCFIPPSDLRSSSIAETTHVALPHGNVSSSAVTDSLKIAVLEKEQANRSDSRAAILKFHLDHKHS
ncbi:unnamed protein product [Rhodiola kirilowii]